MKLFCGRDAKKLGIENPDGTWDFKEFQRHIQDCDICKSGSSHIMSMMGKKGGSVLSPKKLQALKENAKKPRPGRRKKI